MALLLSLVSIAFIFYFFSISAWIVWLLPLLFCMLFIYNVVSRKHTGGTLKQFFSSQSFLIAWGLILLGIFGILSFAGIDYYLIGIILIMINIVGWIISLLSEYDDGKNIFHIGYYMSMGILLWNVAGTQPRLTTLSLLLVLPIFTFGLYSFIVFILRIRAPIEKERESMTFLLFNLMIISFLIQFFIHNLFVGLALSQLYLFLLYRIISFVKSYSKTPFDLPKPDVREILAGKTILSRKKPLKIETLLYFNKFIQQIPMSIKTALSGLNIFLILCIIYSFFTIGDPSSISMQILYRCSIIVFFINFLLLKKINFNYKLQRYSVFFIIHFAVYLGIALAAGYQTLTMALCGVGWSIISSGLIFYSDFMIRRWILQKEDYNYRIGANVVSMLINIYLLTTLKLPVELSFSIIFFYLGISFFLTLQTIKFVKNTYPPTLTIEDILMKMHQD